MIIQAGYDTHAHSAGILKSLKFTRSMKYQQPRTGVPLLEASALPVFISKINLCSKPGKAILQLPDLGLHLPQKARLLHILKTIISFNHSILEKKVINPTAYPLLLAMPRIEPRVLCMPGKCSTMELHPQSYISTT